MVGSAKSRPQRPPASGELRSRHGVLWRIGNAKYCYLMLVPTFVLLIAFSYYPAFSALYHSLFNWNGANVEQFIGVRNFVQILHDPMMGVAMLNTAKLTVAGLIIVLTAPLAVAVMIFRLRSARAGYLYKLIFVVPMVVPWMVTVLIWRFIYEPELGLVNTFLRTIGLGSLARPWLGDYRTALWAIVFIGFPWVTPFAMLIYIAGLQSIPVSLFDSASTDGVGSLGRLVYIELPLIAGQIRLLVILTIINTIQGFATVFVTTSGGPGNATMVPGLYLFNSGLMYNRMGYACAIGTVLFVIILGLTYLNLRYFRAGPEYGSSQ